MIAGDVNLILNPSLSITFSKAGMLSEDGRCKTVDESANGYVCGEGAEAILMKSLTKAVSDGDHIHGVIRESANNLLSYLRTKASIKSVNNHEHNLANISYTPQVGREAMEDICLKLICSTLVCLKFLQERQNRWILNSVSSQ